MDKSPEVRLSSKEESKEVLNFADTTASAQPSETPKEETKSTSSRKDSTTHTDLEDRDRYFDHEKLKDIPSYASVLNNPKKSNYMQWIHSATGEKMQPPEKSEPPPIWDYEAYINKMKKSYNKYMKYHKKEVSILGGKKTIKKADAISAVNKVPDEYFEQEFKLSKEFFKVSNKKEATAKIELCEDYLELVENFLVAHVAENFDFFSQSFNNIRDMEKDMGEIKEAIQEIKDVNDQKRKQVVNNMLHVYFLNRRMGIMKQIRKHLKLIKILHESIPVVKNLIKSGTNFNTVMELIEK